MTRNFYIMLLNLWLLKPLYGQQYYIAGAEALKNREYLKADSLFTLSIDNFETQHAFYNRAIARLGANDFKECCADLKQMSETFNDAESTELYDKYCCNFVDTTYYDRKFIPIESKKYKYYKIKKIHKYSCDTTFTYHKKNLTTGGTVIWFSKSGFKTINIDRTDIYAKSFIFHDNEVFSFIIGKVPVNNSTHEIEKFKLFITEKLTNKYSELDSLENKYLNVRAIINPNGELYKIKTNNYLNNIFSAKDNNSFEAYLNQLFREMPKYKPLEFNDNAVYFLSDFNIKLQ